MKIIIPKKEFRQALNNVMKTVATRSTLPILNNIYLKCRQNAFSVFTTNLECYTEMTVSATIEDGGEITLPARLLLDVINAISAAGSEHVILESQDGKNARVHAGTYNYQLKGIEASEYQEYLPQFNFSFGLSIQGSVLRSMINMARSAVSTDESKPSLTGARAELSGGIFRLVATDSRRLVMTSCKVECEQGHDCHFLIPGKALNDVFGLIGDGQTISIQLNDAANIVSFQVDDLKFYSRLLDGEFPDYRAVIPENPPINITAGTGALKDALEGILPIARENGHIVKIFLQQNQLILEAASSETGLARIELPCQKTGADLEISFNARFLLDALNTICAERVLLGFGKSLTPCLIRPEGDSQDFLWVVMPIRPA
ncbi:MAG: DNA polymerase III subunit beta [Candidatus Wallbacteria bacterium]|nr:DNA polymerase III subunit beta [Candidatus Wallbacteria bacterium]